jgi:hypothetical protein
VRYSIPAACQGHILVGDAKGGGHRYGAGQGKSEFPSSWSDNDILTMIIQVADEPASSSSPAKSGRLKITGTCRGVWIRVIADPASWTVITGYPL